MKKLFLPNRIAVYLNVIAAVAAALAPVVAQLDVTSVAGVVAGLAAVTAVLNNYIRGYQRHEDRVAWQETPPALPVPSGVTEPEPTPEPDAPSPLGPVVVEPQLPPGAVVATNADGTPVSVIVNGLHFVPEGTNG